MFNNIILSMDYITQLGCIQVFHKHILWRTVAVKKGLQISFIWFKIRMHTKNQLPRQPEVDGKHGMQKEDKKYVLTNTYHHQTLYSLKCHTQCQHGFFKKRFFKILVENMENICAQMFYIMTFGPFPAVYLKKNGNE